MGSPTYRNAGRPKGSGNIKSRTVKLTLNRLSFNAVEEFVKAYQELNDPIQKVEALKFLFKYCYPELKAVELTPEQILEMENADIMEIKPAEVSTDNLLKALEKEK